MHHRAERLAVEAGIFQRNVTGPDQATGGDAAMLALFAAHLEQIGKVIVE